MAAPSNPLQTFFAGSGGQWDTPEQIARQREMASLLMQQGNPAFNNAGWLGALGRGLEGGYSGWLENQAGQAETAGLEQRSSLDADIAAALGLGSPAGGMPAGGTALDAVNQVGAVPSGESADRIRAGLLQRGMPEHIADAFILNMQDESGLNPGINEMAPTVPGSRGGYGLYQLTGPRRRAYEAFAGERGVDPSDVDAQLDFLMSELQGPEAKAAESIFAAQDTPTAAAAIVNNFLRPAEQHRARREAAYLGGGGSTPSQAPQVAQAGGSNIDIAQLLGVGSNPWASDSQRQIASMLIGNQMQAQQQANDPLRQAQIAQAQQALRMGELEYNNALHPAAPGPVFEGGQWWDKSSGMPVALTQANVDPTSGMQNYEFLISQGVDPQEAAARAFSGGVNVSVGGAAPAPAQGYQNVFDDSGNLVRQDVIPGSPAALEAEALAAASAAQEGAQIASDIEGAGTTLASTQAVLDLLDDSGGMPTTGTLSQPFAMYSGSPAGKIRSYVSTLQSGVALGAMQRLKEASSTGATGFGSLSAPELNLLISDIGALDPDTTEPEIFRQTVSRINDRAKRVVADIRQNVTPARIEELGLRDFLDSIDPPSDPAETEAEDIDALLELYR